MSAYRFVTLACDQCGEIFDDGRSLGIRECRASAALEHWFYDKARGDTCPSHNGWERHGGYYYRKES